MITGDYGVGPSQQAGPSDMNRFEGWHEPSISGFSSVPPLFHLISVLHSSAHVHFASRILSLSSTSSR